MTISFEEKVNGTVTEAIALFGLSVGDVIDAIFEDGNLDHKMALVKIFSDALSEANKRLENK